MMPLKTIQKIALALTSFLFFISSVTQADEFDEMSIYNLPAKWESQDGTVIDLAELKGNVLVVVMVYTSCRSACPILIGQMKNIEATVKKEAANGIKYILVSIDPENDTPERLKKLSKEYGMTGDQWLFLRGNEETTREFANILAVKYKQISPIDFSHSNIISVFDKRGNLIHQREGLELDSEELITKVIEVAK
jgi:protein SCO1/2